MRFGIIGLGEIAVKSHLSAIEELGGKVTAVCDSNYDKISSFPAARFTDYRDLLAQKDVDVVSICTPNFLHPQMAVDALEAGKKVILEKPIGISTQQARVLTSHPLADKVAVCYQRRFNTEVREIGHYRESIQSVKAQVLVRRDPSYWDTWRSRRSQSGGGSLINIGIHYLDVLRFWLGDEYSVDFAKVATRGGVDQAVYADLNFNGVTVSFFESAIHSARDIFMQVRTRGGKTFTYQTDDATHFDVYDQFLNHNTFISPLEAVKSLKMVEEIYRRGK